MRYYKDPLNTVHALHSAEFAHLLPAGCVEISEVEARSLTNPVGTLDELRERKVREIDAAFSLAAEALLQGYPQAERLTWPTQQSEALAWAVNNSTPTPYLDAIAVARGITPEDMRTRTLEAVQTWMAASQLLVGRRQALRDAAQVAEDEAALAAIAWAPIE